ncbi:MAG: tRNA (uridine(54)-C5)-methyltransferase TrmA [Deltaproteobacteria bacterium]|nr:tRNA (uridine(54)-C5)-methyltransferase TrmA [Deltaproteobacteria bacterium]
MQVFEVSTTDYKTQLAQKTQHLTKMFSSLSIPKIEVFESLPQHYRMRAEFRVWHDGDDLYYIMFNKKNREKYRVDQFPSASKNINRLMPILIETIKKTPLLRKKLFQIDFLSTLSDEILVSLLYHRKIDDDWTKQAKKLREHLHTEGFCVNIIGRARKMKIILNQDHVIEKLHVNGREYIYQQVENSFTQPNAKIAEKMLEWSIDCSKDCTGDLLELYCGNGHFSLALAQNFDKVLATEVSKSSVRSAQYNIKANNIDNVKIIRLSAAEMTEAFHGKRDFKRLKDASIDLKDYNCQTIFVDPPRAGMDIETCNMVKEYDRILYISCNPQTLLSNLEIFTMTHSIQRFAFFDQFPYTHHMEVGIMLSRT